MTPESPRCFLGNVGSNKKKNVWGKKKLKTAIFACLCLFVTFHRESRVQS